jgi:hypothetical protein
MASYDALDVGISIWSRLVGLHTRHVKHLTEAKGRAGENGAVSPLGSGAHDGALERCRPGGKETRSTRGGIASAIQNLPHEKKSGESGRFKTPHLKIADA